MIKPLCDVAIAFIAKGHPAFAFGVVVLLIVLLVTIAFLSR